MSLKVEPENKLTIMTEKSSVTKREVSLNLPPDNNETQATKQPQRKVVGLFWQILILTKKNFLLARRNVVGTLGEILVALLFVLILLIIRYVYDVTRYSDQANISAQTGSTNANPINYVVYNINVSTNFIPKIYYFPNNPYVTSLVTAAFNIIQARQPLFMATCKFKLLLLKPVD
jgi:hypothetical protein